MESLCYHNSGTSQISWIVQTYRTRRSAPTPMVSTSKLTTIHDEPFYDKLLYRCTVSALLYIVDIIPDIYILHRKKAMLVCTTTYYHTFGSIKWVLRYLCGISNFDLLFALIPSFNIEAYSNAYWVNCIDDWRSIGDFTIQFRFT